MRVLVVEDNPNMGPYLEQGLREHGFAVDLVTARDKEAIPVLIDLLAELPADQVMEVVEILTVLAGDQAPKTSPGADVKARQKDRDLWATWLDRGPTGIRRVRSGRDRRASLARPISCQLVSTMATIRNGSKDQCSVR